jgi:hypothetical protein
MTVEPGACGRQAGCEMQDLAAGGGRGRPWWFACCSQRRSNLSWASWPCKANVPHCTPVHPLVFVYLKRIIGTCEGIYGGRRFLGATCPKSEYCPEATGIISFFDHFDTECILVRRLCVCSAERRSGFSGTYEFTDVCHTHICTSVEPRLLRHPRICRHGLHAI